MLIHPWDAGLDSAEWQDCLASTDRFGMLDAGAAAQQRRRLAAIGDWQARQDRR
jgi:hypothetical protein